MSVLSAEDMWEQFMAWGVHWCQGNIALSEGSGVVPRHQKHVPGHHSSEVSHQFSSSSADWVDTSRRWCLAHAFLGRLMTYSSAGSSHVQPNLMLQPYVGKATTLCNSNDTSNSVLGYTCNSITQRSCQAYLTFRSEPPFNTVGSISGLLGADPTQLSQLNSAPENQTFATNGMVLVPVNCCCSGQYYQANTSYSIAQENTYFLIANNTFQGLSTCQALQDQDGSPAQNFSLATGTSINVPLRCACPTKNQSDIGVRYLLSYLVILGNSVRAISSQFGVDTERTLTANGLSDQDYNIYPFTTLLVPLQNPPISNQTAEPPLPPPPPPAVAPSLNKSSSITWRYVLLGVLGGGSLALVIGAIIFCTIDRRQKKKTDQITVSELLETQDKPLETKLQKTTGEFLEELLETHDKPLETKLQKTTGEFLEGLSSIAQSLKVYTFEELQSATDNFSPVCLIKGSVYCGTIKGDFAAIKRMNGDVSKEINLLNRINHFNLIRLSGICFNDGNWYLVYEYAGNGPLSNWIYHENDDHKILNWTQRIQIALDVATGLNYLHSYASPPYVHKDLKCTNVLLDSDFRAKITNFNLARSADGEEGQFALTRHIVGTKGYMAPEYLENGLISPKLDVYAFGVLLMEILTGKEFALLYEGEKKHLSDVLVTVLHEEDGRENLSNFMDPYLQCNYPVEVAIFVVRLIDNCIKKDPSGRPGMDEIVLCLSRTLNTKMSGEFV
ncbi:unnamed protein product [Ilex paraguariensis]|uniref:LysM domain receptor-like kinase 4 n=1 Tax=Ilex paraguariensis TaxID=185542 RepID=A0ABC8SPB9_9AQUA